MKLVLSALFALVSMNAVADIVKSLPASDRLGKVAEAIGTQLRDGNISTGTTQLWAGEVELDSPKAIKELVAEGFAQAYKKFTQENLPKSAHVTYSVTSFVDGEEASGTVHKMTKAIMESNDYDTTNKQLWEAQARYLWVVLRQMPVSEKTKVAHAETKLKDSSSGENRTIQYFLVVNADRKAVQFFTIEGSM